jgi:hypothetical protein
MSSTDTVTTLERLANLLRIHSIESTQEANSGLIEFLVYLFISLFNFLIKIVIQQVVHQWLK